MSQLLEIEDEFTGGDGNKRFLLGGEDKPSVRRWNAQPGQTDSEASGASTRGQSRLGDNADADEATDAGKEVMQDAGGCKVAQEQSMTAVSGQLM